MPSARRAENRSLRPHSEPTLGQVLRLAIREWAAGNREHEFRLHLLFLSRYYNVGATYLTGYRESTYPSAQLAGLFSAVYETFTDSILEDPEVLYIG